MKSGVSSVSFSIGGWKPSSVFGFSGHFCNALMETTRLTRETRTFENIVTCTDVVLQSHCGNWTMNGRFYMEKVILSAENLWFGSVDDREWLDHH